MTSLISTIVRERDWENVVKLLRSPDGAEHAMNLFPISPKSRIDSKEHTLLEGEELQFVPLINVCFEHEETALLLLELDPEPVAIFVSPDGDTPLHTICKSAAVLPFSVLTKLIELSSPGVLIFVDCSLS